jgi:hypothetical protein
MAAPVAALLLALLASVSLPALQAQTFVSTPVPVTQLALLRTVPGPVPAPQAAGGAEEPRSAAAEADDIPFLTIPTIDAEGVIVNTSTRSQVDFRAPVAGRQYIPPNAATRPTDLVRIAMNELTNNILPVHSACTGYYLWPHLRDTCTTANACTTPVLFPRVPKWLWHTTSCVQVTCHC